MELIAIYLAAGIAAGLVSGMFGLGGGLTIVPALAFALPLEGVNQKYVMHLAVGTTDPGRAPQAGDPSADGLNDGRHGAFLSAIDMRWPWADQR